MVCDGNGLPLAARLTCASASELRHALPVIDAIRVEKRGPGRAKQRPKTLVADMGYDSRAFRHALRSRSIQPVIPGRRWPSRKRRTGRPQGTFAKARPNHRWKIERTNAWFDNFRRLVTRFERKHQIFDGFLQLAAAMICLNEILR